MLNIVNSDAISLFPHRWEFGPDAFCYNHVMAKRAKKKKSETAVFDSIRKPVAPPSQKLGKEKPEIKIHPAERKVKYKRPVETED